VLLGLIKIILLWWIITVALNWYRGLKRHDRPVPHSDAQNDEKRAEHSGNIVDAEFEEIDETKRPPS
jgi:hypothetical protein